MQLRLGKLPPKKDRRTLRLATVLRALPPIPETFDVDESLGGIPITPMFANDTFSDCVIAGQAHHTLRFEKFEQAKLLKISDQDVVKEYFKQTGNLDTGLYMLDSLNAWRRGWLIGDQRYCIDAFGIVNQLDWDEVRAVMYLFHGTNTGFSLPRTADEQFKNGKRWEVETGPGSEPGSWGGHALYVKRAEKALTKTLLTCCTWGKLHEMSLEFFRAYCDEAYGIVDAIDAWVDPAANPLDVEKLRQYLNEITGDQPLRMTSLTLPAGVVGQPYSAGVYATGGAPPYTWSIYTGAIPVGLSLDEATGIISGTPVEAGTSLVIFKCTDSSGSTTGGGIWLQVNSSPVSPPPIPEPEPPPGPTPSPCKVGKTTAAAMQAVANIFPSLANRKGRYVVKYLNPANS